MFENRVVMSVFGAKRGEVTWCWRKSYNEEIHNLYSQPNIFQMTKKEKES
jgi:hypothetical protein